MCTVEEKDKIEGGDGERKSLRYDQVWKRTGIHIQTGFDLRLLSSLSNSLV